MPEFTVPFSETEQYEDRYVALIDILGFSQAINNETFEKIRAIFKHFESRISDGLISRNLNEKENTKAQKGEKWTGGKGFIPAFTIFSDTIFISVPENIFSSITPEISHKFGFSEEYRQLVNNQMKLFILTTLVINIQIKLLEYGYLSRGALTFGKLYSKNGIWFGPAIAEAACLEKEVSIFPRVILSETLNKIFDFEKILKSEFPGAIEKDSDNIFFCDYISWLHTASSMKDKEFGEVLYEVRETVSKKIESFSDPKIKAKWQWLFNKIETKQSIISKKVIQEKVLPVS